MILIMLMMMMITTIFGMLCIFYIVANRAPNRRCVVVDHVNMFTTSAKPMDNLFPLCISVV